MLKLFQVQAKNQLRVNGLGYYMYYGSFLIPMLAVVMIFYTCLLVLAQVKKHKLYHQKKGEKDFKCNFLQVFQLSSITLSPAFTTFALLYFIFPFGGILFASTARYV